MEDPACKVHSFRLCGGDHCKEEGAPAQDPIKRAREKEGGGG